MSIYTILLIIFVAVNTIASQLVLKKGLIGLTSPQNLISLWPFFSQVLQTPYFYIALSLQGVGYFIWMLVISRMKLGIAFAISGSSFYILLAIMSWFFYGEQLTFMQWVGIAIVSIGLFFIIWPTQ